MTKSKIFVTGGSRKAREFFDALCKMINMNSLQSKFFREYYRSGNIFLYRIDGKFDQTAFKEMSRVYGEEGLMQPGTLPVKYIMLNPFDISAKRATSFAEGAYFKVLSEYDIEVLANPKTALLGAAAQFGIFSTLIGALWLSGAVDAISFSIQDASAIAIMAR